MLNLGKKKLTRNLFAALLSAGQLAGMMPAQQSQAAAVTYPLITEVYADTNVSFEPDEYMAVTNPTASAITLTGCTCRSVRPN